jgi:cysteine desulfurase
MIYLDYAATTPMSDEALEVFQQAAKKFYGNSSSLHDIGSNANILLETCRCKLASLLNVDKNGIYFTSGGSESNILALQSIIDTHRKNGNHLITSVCEHPSVYYFFKKLEKQGFEVTYLPINEYGVIDLNCLKQSIKSTTILASIQYANSEIGTIQPIDAISEILHNHNVIFHCDAVQAFGKISIDINKQKIDALSISSHKVYGPKGVGAVYINPNLSWNAQIPGTTHEKGFRPGTINVPGIASFTAAATNTCEMMIEERKRLAEIRNEILRLLKTNVPMEIVVEGDPTNHLPNILGLRITGMEGQLVMLEANRHGLAISTGSACSITNQKPSRTIKSLGRTEAECYEFIRISFGRYTTNQHIQPIINILKKITSEHKSKLRYSVSN